MSLYVPVKKIQRKVLCVKVLENDPWQFRLYRRNLTNEMKRNETTRHSTARHGTTRNKTSRKGKEKKAKRSFCRAEILQFLKGNISFNMRPWELKISPITVGTNFHKLFNRLESIPIYCDAFYTQSYNMPMRQKVNNDVGKDHPII